MRLATYPILHLALRFLLLKKLHKITEISAQIRNSTKPIATQTPTPSTLQAISLLVREIPLKQINKFPLPYYGSAIALKLSKLTQQTTLELAETIANHLTHDIATSHNTDANSPLEQVWQHFTVQVDRTGWIYLSLGETGLANWLQILVDLPKLSSQTLESRTTLQDLQSHQTRNSTDMKSIAQNSSKVNNSIRITTEILLPLRHSVSAKFDLRTSTDLFQIQHAHARCYALLQLAHRERWIQLEILPFNLLTIATPHALPWLEVLPALPETSFDRHYIRQLESTWNELVQLDPINTQRSLKLAQTASQNFQHFHATCPIFGLPNDQPALSQVRLGLVLITQSLLRSLLLDYLGVAAPTAL